MTCIDWSLNVLSRCQSSQADDVDIECFPTWNFPDRKQSVVVWSSLYSDLGGYPPDPQKSCYHFLWKSFTKDFEKKPTKVALNRGLVKLVGACHEVEQEMMYSV
jgi:hypothetical protein